MEAQAVTYKPQAENMSSLFLTSPKGGNRKRNDFFFVEEVKLAHPNWHRVESNLRPWGGENSKVSSQHHQGQPKWVL